MPLAKKNGPSVFTAVGDIERRFCAAAVVALFIVPMASRPDATIGLLARAAWRSRAALKKERNQETLLNSISIARRDALLDISSRQFPEMHKISSVHYVGVVYA